MTYRIAVMHDGFVPAYREPFFALLNQISAHDYVIIHGDPPRNTGHIALPGPFAFPNHRVRNRELHIGSRFVVYEPVLRYVLNGDFDAIVVGHEVKFVSAMALFGLFRARGRPALLWGHGYHKPSAAWPARASSRWLVRNADGFLAYTERGASMVEEAGLPRERITVVRNTIDMAPQKAAHARYRDADPKALRADLGLRPDAQTLLYIGRLSPRKRVDEAIRLVQRLEAEGRAGPVDLLVVGGGPMQAELEALAGGAGNIRFLGDVYDPDEVAKLMRVAVGVVIPGVVGLAVTHAFAQGKPMITQAENYHSPEIEYLRHDENGLIVSGGFESLVDTVASFLSDKALQERLCAAALATRETLSLDYAAKQFDGGVCRAIEERRPRDDRVSET